MSLGIYGNVKLADVSADDIDIFYSYNETRETPGDIQLKPLFSQATNNDFIKMIGVDGAYKLRLPADIFNKIGFYSVIIKPKTFQTTIVDCSFVITNDANQTQISKKGIPVVKRLPQLRVGIYPVEWADKTVTMESHWHNFAFNKDWADSYKKDWAISYTKDVAEIMELRNHPFFVGTQYHPEYISRPLSPHPVFIAFLKSML